MKERVVCPVCGTRTRRRRFPNHLASDHLRGRLREAYAYSAFWAGVLPALALALVLVQAVLLVLRIPRQDALRDALATHVGVLPESTPTVLTLVVAPGLAVVLGVLVVALARGPGQEVKRGWRPRRFEYLLVVTWLVPFVGPGLYAMGAGRRFVAVRFVREKVAAGVVAASSDLADADAALAANDDAAAATAFAAAGTLLQSIRDDTHFRNPTVAAHLDAHARVCWMAATIGEHHASQQAASNEDPHAR